LKTEAEAKKILKIKYWLGFSTRHF
jgi:hypothetical protein